MFALSFSSCLHAVEIIGHRGAPFDAPENTILSFQKAWEAGADAVEGDFWLTKDGVVVCSHDPKTLDLDITKSTLSEIKEVYPLMPTLQEVLATVPKGKKFYIEIKRGKEIVPHVKKAIESSGLSNDQITMLSFDKEVVKANRQIMPEVKNFYSIAFALKDQRPHQFGKSPQELFDQACELGATGLCLQGDKTQVAQILALQKKPLPWVVWTIDDVEQAKEFSDMGALGIISNVPAKMKESL